MLDTQSVRRNHARIIRIIIFCSKTVLRLITLSRCVTWCVCVCVYVHKQYELSKRQTDTNQTCLRAVVLHHQGKNPNLVFQSGLSLDLSVWGDFSIDHWEPFASVFIHSSCHYTSLPCTCITLQTRRQFALNMRRYTWTIAKPRQFNLHAIDTHKFLIGPSGDRKESQFERSIYHWVKNAPELAEARALCFSTICRL